MRGSDSEQMAKLTDAMNTWRREHPQVSFGSSHALLGEADVGAVLEVQDANLHASTLNLPVRWKVKRSRVRSCASVS